MCHFTQSCASSIMSLLISSSNNGASSLLIAVFFMSVIATTILTMGEQRQERLLFLPGKPFKKTLNLFNSVLNGPRNKVSPLFLINGTICRYINSTPVCTVLATTGLQMAKLTRPSVVLSAAASSGARAGGGAGGGGGGGGSTSGSSGGAGARPGSGGGGGGGGGSSVGGGNSGGGGGNRPATANQLGGSSVQYLGRPLADDSLDLQVSSNESRASALQAAPALGVLHVRRRPLGLFGMRRRIPMAQPQQPEASRTDSYIHSG